MCVFSVCCAHFVARKMASMSCLSSLSSSSSSLFRAAQRGNLKGVKRHFDTQTVLYMYTREYALCERALQVAIRNDEAAVVLYLWPFCVHDLYNFLSYAGKYGGTRVISTLVHKLCANNVDAASDLSYAFTCAIDGACDLGNKSTVQCLARAKVRVDGATHFPPLYSGIVGGHAGVVACLLQFKASPHLPLCVDETPLQLAIRKQRQSVVRVLERALEKKTRRQLLTL